MVSVRFLYFSCQFPAKNGAPLCTVAGKGIVPRSGRSAPRSTFSSFLLPRRIRGFSAPDGNSPVARDAWWSWSGSNQLPDDYGAAAMSDQLTLSNTSRERWVSALPTTEVKQRYLQSKNEGQRQALAVLCS